MNCPSCNSNESKVLDSRKMKSGKKRRSRVCLDCGQKFLTYELSETLIEKGKELSKRDIEILTGLIKIVDTQYEKGELDRTKADSLKRRVVKNWPELRNYV